MMCGDRWLTTGSPWEGDEMTEREQFEKVHCRNNRDAIRRNEVGDYVLPSIQDAYSGFLSGLEAARATTALPQGVEEWINKHCCGAWFFDKDVLCVSADDLRAFLSGMAIVPVEFIQVLQDAPEINPSNYDHDQVCRLNTAVNEALAMLAAAKEKGE